MFLYISLCDSVTIPALASGYAALRSFLISLLSLFSFLSLFLVFLSLTVT